MDELTGLLFEQIAKKVRESRERQRAQPAPQRRFGPAQAVTTAPVARAMRQGPPAPPAPPAPQAGPAAPSRMARPVRPEPPAPPPPDPFASPNAESGSARNPFLAAFAGGGGLLAGIVLAEALAPPVSLRQRHPDHA